MPIEIGKWVRGWRLDKIFHDKQHDEPAITAQQHGISTDKVDEIAKKAVGIAEKVKAWVNNPVEDLVVKLFPEWAQQAEGKLETYLPVIISGLLAIKDPLAMQEALKGVKFSTNFYWDKFFHDLAVAIASVLVDGKIDFADLTVAIQFVKDEFFGKKEAA